MHSVKILFVGPAGAGKEWAVAQLARVLRGQPEAGAGWAFGMSSCLGAAGGRIGLADLAAPAQLAQRLRASSLGLEVVDGPEVVLHLYWLPVELVPGLLRPTRMAGEWLRGADGVVYVADGRPERDRDNASGLADLEAWLAIHEPDARISALQVIHHGEPARAPGLAIAGVPTFETVAATGEGIDALARHLLAVAPRRRTRPARRKRLAA